MPMKYFADGLLLVVCTWQADSLTSLNQMHAGAMAHPVLWKARPKESAFNASAGNVLHNPRVPKAKSRNMTVSEDAQVVVNSTNQSAAKPLVPIPEKVIESLPMASLAVDEEHETEHGSETNASNKSALVHPAAVKITRKPNTSANISAAKAQREPHLVADGARRHRRIRIGAVESKAVVITEGAWESKVGSMNAIDPTFGWLQSLAARFFGFSSPRNTR